ncbi:MAG TPA: NAD-dependent protein deacylase [Acholeplasmataceae bacterium]|jgi:NAD-dependent deacetylase|nr:NAD-dependent protein deacylase [Acholeplasmataceae bacterium]
MQEKIQKLAHILKETKNMVFFGGAGVSVASNIPDFRSSTGLFQEKGAVPPEDILSRSYFDKHPEEFYRFYKTKMVYPEARPNPAHDALAELEAMGKLKAVITQNIDNLHQMSGSKNVIELHGTVLTSYCLKCRKTYTLEYILKSEGVPYCDCGGLIKPDVVLYEEPLSSEALERSLSYLAAADTLLVAGTSLLVNPAAGLVRYFSGDNFIIINKGKTPYDAYADLVIHGDVAIVLPEALLLSKE